MKMVTLKIEDNKLEQFMIVINSLKSDMVKKFEIKKESGSSVDMEPTTFYKYCDTHNRPKGA